MDFFLGIIVGMLAVKLLDRFMDWSMKDLNDYVVKHKSARDEMEKEIRNGRCE